MSQAVALVTGAGGEMGHAILPRLRQAGARIVAVDLVALQEDLQGLCDEAVEASVTDFARMADLVRQHRPQQVFHLAAVLSRKAESDPDLAHRVNVDGTYHLLRTFHEEARRRQRSVQFLFPSSIAVYGIPDAATKRAAGAVREDEWVRPAGMYGCNKLYGEALGAYMSGASRRGEAPGLDFRSIRFPGLISADTLPTGGTTDYASEMIHAAARGEPYRCFVSADTRLPFMTMPDAVEAMLRLAAAPVESLTRTVYNIRGFSPSAAEIRDEVLRHFRGASIDFAPAAERQRLVDTWPADVDDGPARRDWGLAPEHGLAEAVGDYLAPALRQRYSGATAGG